MAAAGWQGEEGLWPTHSAPITTLLPIAHRHLGCADAACPLCVNNPQRKCGSSFCSRYFQGAALAAACGAPISVAAFDAGGAAVGGLGAGLQLEVRGTH